MLRPGGLPRLSHATQAVAPPGSSGFTKFATKAVNFEMAPASAFSLPTAGATTGVPFGGFMSSRTRLAAPCTGGGGGVAPSPSSPNDASDSGVATAGLIVTAFCSGVSGSFFSVRNLVTLGMSRRPTGFLSGTGPSGSFVSSCACTSSSFVSASNLCGN